MSSGVTFIIKQQVFPTLHTDAHDRLDDISTYHKPHFPQDPKCFQAFSQQHGAIRRGAFRHGAHGDGRLRRLVCRRRQPGCGGFARTATWRRATSGDRVVRRLVCVLFSSHVSSHISRRVICVSRLCVHGCNRAQPPQRP